MKFILNFFRIVISLILSLAFTVVLLSTCVLQPVVELLQPENIAEQTETIIESVVEEMKTNPEGEMAQTITSITGEFGLDQQATQQLLENEGVQQLASEFVETIVNKTTGADPEAQYPDKEEIVDVIDENIEELVPILGGNAENVSKEDIQKIVDENYDQAISYLEQMLNAYMNSESNTAEGE